jgi:hypothetical protein
VATFEEPTVEPLKVDGLLGVNPTPLSLSKQEDPQKLNTSIKPSDDPTGIRNEGSWLINIPGAVATNAEFTPASERSESGVSLILDASETTPRTRKSGRTLSPKKV